MALRSIASKALLGRSTDGTPQTVGELLAQWRRLDRPQPGHGDDSDVEVVFEPDPGDGSDVEVVDVADDDSNADKEVVDDSRGSLIFSDFFRCVFCGL